MNLMKREQRESEWYNEVVEIHSIFTEKVQQLVIQSHNNAQSTKREDEEKTRVVIQNYDVTNHCTARISVCKPQLTATQGKPGPASWRALSSGSLRKQPTESNNF